MKKQTILNPKGILNAKALGIKNPIELCNFSSVTLWSKNSLRLTKKTGKDFWIYSLKDAETIFLAIKNEASELLTISKEMVLQDLEKRTNKLQEAISTRLNAVGMQSSELFIQLQCVGITAEEFNQLLMGTLPVRFSTDVGQHVLAYALYSILGKPEDFIGKDLYWRKTISKNV